MYLCVCIHVRTKSEQPHIITHTCMHQLVAHVCACVCVSLQCFCVRARIWRMQTAQMHSFRVFFCAGFCCSSVYLCLLYSSPYLSIYLKIMHYSACMTYHTQISAFAFAVCIWAQLFRRFASTRALNLIYEMRVHYKFSRFPALHFSMSERIFPGSL